MLMTDPHATPAPAKSGAPDADNLVFDTTTATFMKDVMEASRTVPVLVDFWAPWCGPCKTLTPVLERVVRAAGGAVRLAKMNIDDYPEIPGQLGIQSVPAVLAFVNGQPVDGFMGAVPEAQVRGFIERVTGKPIKGDPAQALQAADALLQAGDLVGASEGYADILNDNPEHAGALAGMAHVRLASDDLDGARAILFTIKPADREAAPVARVRALIALAEETAGLSDAQALVARVEADPDDHAARLDLARVLNAHGKREEAMAHLIESVRRDRSWNEDAARKELVKFFSAWGFSDPHAIEGRRRLSSVLFS